MSGIQTDDQRTTIASHQKVYSSTGSTGRIVRQAGIRNRQKSQTGRDVGAGRVVRQAGIGNGGERLDRQAENGQQAGTVTKLDSVRSASKQVPGVSCADDLTKRAERQGFKYWERLVGNEAQLAE